MNSRIRWTVLMAWCALAFWAPRSFAQEDKANLSPLRVTAQISGESDADCRDGVPVLVQFWYGGTQPLRGYLVVLNSNEWVTGIRQQSVQEIRGPGEAMIQSGEEWSRSVCLGTNSSEVSHSAESGAENPELLTVSVDVLKFADGSNWGPKSLPESNRLLGTFDGMDFGVKRTDLERYVSPIPPEKAPIGVQDIESQAIGPLTFKSGVWRDERGRDFLAVDATNSSDRPIRGYVSTEIFLDPATGAMIRRVTTKQLATHENPSEYLAPGASWTSDPRKFSYLLDGSLADYKIALDFVIFGDGSAFGPKKSRESDEVLGMIDGIHMASARN